MRGEEYRLRNTNLPTVPGSRLAALDLVIDDWEALGGFQSDVLYINVDPYGPQYF